MASTQLSRATYDRLRTEFEDLTTRGRIELAEKIERAREEGDLKENAGYHAAKDEQGHMEGRIRQLEYLLETAEVIEGCSIYTFVYEGDTDDQAERYMIGHIEEEPPEGVEVMGPDSPLGEALVGASAGELVSYEAPGGRMRVRVIRVDHV
ncbi:MAG: transcription elongation factor GreA [Ilumatobacter sp.]|nr:MAG: transcription elongation factor GreA [Ilumatobacter sp.]